MLHEQPDISILLYEQLSISILLCEQLGISILLYEQPSISILQPGSLHHLRSVLTSLFLTRHMGKKASAGKTQGLALFMAQPSPPVHEGCWCVAKPFIDLLRSPSLAAQAGDRQTPT